MLRKYVLNIEIKAYKSARMTSFEGFTYVYIVVRRVIFTPTFSYTTLYLRIWIDNSNVFRVVSALHQQMDFVRLNSYRSIRTSNIENLFDVK